MTALLHFEKCRGRVQNVIFSKSDRKEYSDLTPVDISSSFNSSDSDLTLISIEKVGNTVYLYFYVANVTITAGNHYVKVVLSSNKPKALAPVSLFSGNAQTFAAVNGCINENGALIIRSGGVAVSTSSGYYVTAIYRVA